MQRGLALTSSAEAGCICQKRAMGNCEGRASEARCHAGLHTHVHECRAEARTHNLRN